MEQDHHLDSEKGRVREIEILGTRWMALCRSVLWVETGLQFNVESGNYDKERSISVLVNPRATDHFVMST